MTENRGGFGSLSKGAVRHFLSKNVGGEVGGGVGEVGGCAPVQGVAVGVEYSLSGGFALENASESGRSVGSC